MGGLVERVLVWLAPAGVATAAPVTYWDYKCVGNTRYRRLCRASDPVTCGAWEVYGTCKPIP